MPVSLSTAQTRSSLGSFLLLYSMVNFPVAVNFVNDLCRIESCIRLKMSDIHFFLSYSRSDAEFAHSLASTLIDEGYDIWGDSWRIPPGVDWSTEIRNAIWGSAGVIMLISPDSVNSAEVRNEIDYALELGKFILPVVIGECERPFRIRSLHYIDYATDNDAGYQAILTALYGIYSSYHDTDESVEEVFSDYQSEDTQVYPAYTSQTGGLARILILVVVVIVILLFISDDFSQLFGW